MSLMVPPYKMLVGGQRAALSGASDTTAPTLTLPLGLPLGDTSGYLGVTTNEGNGTLYYVVTTSATPPSKAQVKAGQNDGGTAAVYAGNQAVSSTGAKEATATGLSSATAYYAYFMHEDASGNQSTVSAATVFTTLTTGTSDTSFDNLIAAMSAAPTDLRKGYIARRIFRLYAAGVWSKIDLDYRLAAHDSQAARLNWKSPSTFALSEVNSPSFVVDRGYTGNGTSSYLDTGWDAATNGVNYQQNSAFISVYMRTSGNNTCHFGTRTAFNITITGNAGTAGDARVNGGSALANTAGGAVPVENFGRRTVSTDTTVGRDGVQLATGARTSSALSSVDLSFLAGASAFSVGQNAGGMVAGYLDDTEVAAVYTADNEWMVALGADT